MNVNTSHNTKIFLGIGALVLASIINVALVRGSIIFWVNAALIFAAIVYFLYLLWRGPRL